MDMTVADEPIESAGDHAIGEQPDLDGTSDRANGGDRIHPEEVNGPKGPEPTRFGDWERKGRCIDF